MVFTAKIDTAKFSAAFQKIPLLAAKELRLELKPVCRTITIDAKRNHRFHSKSNQLERSIRYEVKPSGLSAEIMLDEGIASYGKYQHDGTKPHIIAPKNKAALAFVKGGRKVIVPKKWGKFWDIKNWNEPNTTFSKKGYVNHPGIKPDKFLYKAAQRQESLFLARINGAVRRVIEMAGF